METCGTSNDACERKSGGGGQEKANDTMANCIKMKRQGAIEGRGKMVYWRLGESEQGEKGRRNS